MKVNLRTDFPCIIWEIIYYGHSKCNIHKKIFVNIRLRYRYDRRRDAVFKQRV
jgi:hypothetical protein